MKSEALPTSPDLNSTVSNFDRAEYMNISEMRVPSRKANPDGTLGEEVTDEDIIEAHGRRRRESHSTGKKHWNRLSQLLDVTTVDPNPEVLDDRSRLAKSLGGTAVRHIVKLNSAWTNEAREEYGAQYHEAAVAAANEADRVIGINTPGVKYPLWGKLRNLRRNRLTLQQAIGLLKDGSFRGISEAQYGAYKEATEEEPSSEIDLIVASMGQAALAGFLQAAVEDGRGEDLRNMVIYEGVGTKKVSPIEQFRRFSKSGDPKPALAGSPEIIGNDDEGAKKWFKRVAASLLSNAALGVASTRGSVYKDLDLDRLRDEAPNIHFLIANGSESVVSPTADNDEFAEKLKEKGINVTRIVVEDGNHIDDLNPRVAVHLLQKARNITKKSA